MTVDLGRIVQDSLLDELVIRLKTSIFADKTLNFHFLLFLEDPLGTYLLLELLDGLLRFDSLLIELSDF